jgi:hypothetical protein
MTPATVPTPIQKSAGASLYPLKDEASASAVSWAAVSGGAFVSAALLLSLTALGAGIGLSSLSPWSNSGLSSSTVGIGALLWLAVAEIIACGIGGYVAGRLRTKWVDVHTDEVYFRDTAHGFLVWAVSLVIMAAVLTSAGTMLAGGGSRSANAPRLEPTTADSNRYFIDSLYRSSQPAGGADDALRAETGAIFDHALRQRELTPEDKNFISQSVVAKTGLTRAEAEKRVTDVFGQDQQMADNARKAVAHSLYWMFVSLLIGAFAASLAATLGGRQRDRMRM